LNLFEYQGKQLLARSGVSVPEGRVASTPDEAAEIAESFRAKVVVKAQVRTGGRGKAGGVIVAENPRAAREAAESILRLSIKGHRVRRVLVEKAVDITGERYASVMLDRRSRSHLFIVCPRGGVDIEALALEEPEALLKLQVDPLLGLASFQISHMVKFLEIDHALRDAAGRFLESIFRVYIASDATLVEVNPMVTTPSELLALDAKVSLDDSASFRHPDRTAWQDDFEVDSQEAVARDLGLSNFVRLNGDVGVIGNGAGLVMSTLDMVDQVGGRAANFLDVGGGADPTRLSAALELVLSDGRAKSVLINVFGGITRCDQVAEGIVNALSRLEVKVPIVVRLAGTNAEAGRKILFDFNHPRVISSTTMSEAASEAVEATG
jgi:succinyl-CoA synthetase beta subunit